MPNIPHAQTFPNLIHSDHTHVASKIDHILTPHPYYHLLTQPQATQWPTNAAKVSIFAEQPCVSSLADLHIVLWPCIIHAANLLGSEPPQESFNVGPMPAMNREGFLCIIKTVKGFYV